MITSENRIIERYGKLLKRNETQQHAPLHEPQVSKSVQNIFTPISQSKIKIFHTSDSFH